MSWVLCCWRAAFCAGWREGWEPGSTSTQHKHSCMAWHFNKAVLLLHPWLDQAWFMMFFHCNLSSASTYLCAFRVLFLVIFQKNSFAKFVFTRATPHSLKFFLLSLKSCHLIWNSTFRDALPSSRLADFDNFCPHCSSDYLHKNLSLPHIWFPDTNYHFVVMFCKSLDKIDFLVWSMRVISVFHLVYFC